MSLFYFQNQIQYHFAKVPEENILIERSNISHCEFKVRNRENAIYSLNHTFDSLLLEETIAWLSPQNEFDCFQSSKVLFHQSWILLKCAYHNLRFCF